MTESRTPPVLKTRFMRNLGMLLLINIIPVIGGIYFTVELLRGKFKVRDEGVILLLLAILLIAVVFLFFWWVLLPMARWLRDYAWWCCVNRSALLWFAPSVVGLVVWAAVGLCCVLICGVMVYVTVAAVIRTVTFFF